MAHDKAKNSKKVLDAIRTTALDEVVGFHMRKAILRAQSTFATVAGKKLMTGQYSVMAIINENPGRTQSAIAEAAGLDRSSLVPILNKFEDEGLILRAPVKGDKRAYAVRLTKKGERELAELESKVREIEAKVISGLGTKDHQTLIDLLKRFHEII
ncbi:MarR family winged helix-turn-helix transcriptional regulator [Sneathiella sp. HT1-7]|jgi:DNA-binding MarR family transcriptional regulator|uniref:MarR family winged helix-turn-helix transcriptional regulator n=1 Tax=Sneathiella sp. HT1-7 TaxID=2887192 RepID=UPI001D137168|nr:MarR family transcriptional regulator [Sneathiella sp. HT1-7]MCC3303583.1 MarR family transcriptional regulator [Sneathiella sp. HT1-7]